MNKTTIEHELNRRGQLLFQTVGDSMEPILHHRCSSVLIQKAEKPLSLYDVVLFHRPPDGTSHGAYVLHRIVKVRKKDYLICGDNRIYREAVPPEWILGVMVGFFNSDEYVDCGTNEAYRRYVKSGKRRYRRRWLRALPGRIARRIKRILK